MRDLFGEPDDATPLDPDARNGLLQSWITYRKDLNAAEEDNIVKGAAWARRSRRRKPTDILDPDFACQLHKRMFGDVWSWAGTYRTTGRNIGIDAFKIPPETAGLFDDVRYWVAHRTFVHDELAIRFHHRLVSIHPFPNGNGRHARLMADMLVSSLGAPIFSWGSGALTEAGELRRRYIAALKSADSHDIGPLLEFARL